MKRVRRVLGGAVLGAITGAFIGLPAAVLADWFLISEAAFEGPMYVRFAGLLGAWSGFQAGAASGLAIAILLEGYRSGRLGERELTWGGLATAACWIVVAARMGATGGLDESFSPLAWIVAALGLGWTVLATSFARTRGKAMSVDRQA